MIAADFKAAIQTFRQSMRDHEASLRRQADTFNAADACFDAKIKIMLADQIDHYCRQLDELTSTDNDSI